MLRLSGNWIPPFPCRLRSLMLMQFKQAQRTEFSRRKLEKAGGFYDAQRTLLQWQITNTLMDNVYFFNTEDDPVYAYNMVNSGEKVYRYRLAAAGFNKEKVMQLLDGNAESPWLAAQNDRRSALLYAAYARIDTATQNGLLFSIDTDALQALMDSAAVYVSSATYLCDSAGNIIYTADPLNDAIRSQVQYLISMPEDRGLCHSRGENCAVCAACCTGAWLDFPKYCTPAGGVCAAFSAMGDVLCWIAGHFCTGRHDDCISHASELHSHT